MHEKNEPGDKMRYNWMEIKKPLLTWYEKNHRKLPWRDTKEPYYVWLSEIMLQQTRVEAVKGYYNRFLEKLPDIDALAKVPEQRLLKLWEGLGYYNRARNLQKAAIQIVERFDGVFPCEYDEVKSLPGIGDYTAGAICSICFGKPTPAVDGNVLRVVMRLADCYYNIDEDKTKRQVREWLMELYREGDCGVITQGLMELGATVCIPNGAPKCMECPLREMCRAYEGQTFDKLPVRKPKKKRQIVDMTVFVLHDGEKYGIQKRDSKGLLANLWEFYHEDCVMDKQQALDFVSDKGFQPVHIEKEIPYTHIFTHVEWRMKAYYIACRNQKADLTWVSKDELKSDYALPAAFGFFLEKEDET
jgi:A/G-specific adenine glycosylase